MKLERYTEEQQMAAKDYDPNTERIIVRNDADEICCIITIDGALNAREHMAAVIMRVVPQIAKQ